MSEPTPSELLQDAVNGDTFVQDDRTLTWTHDGKEYWITIDEVNA